MNEVTVFEYEDTVFDNEVTVFDNEVTVFGNEDTVFGSFSGFLRRFLASWIRYLVSMKENFNGFAIRTQSNLLAGGLRANLTPIRTSYARTQGTSAVSMNGFLAPLLPRLRLSCSRLPACLATQVACAQF